MLGILNSDTRMNLVYQLIKDKVDCILLDDFSVLRVKFDEILLPMSGLRDDDVMIVRGIEMKCPKEFFSMLKEDGRLICGNVTPKLKELPYKIINLNDVESFILANSKLTAEGVLYLLLDNTDYGLLDLNIDLIGYGHSGKAIYDLFKSMNMKVRVVRRAVDEKHEDFITVDELAHLISSVVMQNEINGIINVCKGEPISLAERVEQFIKEHNLDIKLEYGAFPERPYDSPCEYGDITKIQKIINNR